MACSHIEGIFVEDILPLLQSNRDPPKALIRSLQESVQHYRHLSAEEIERHLHCSLGTQSITGASEYGAIRLKDRSNAALAHNEISINRFFSERFPDRAVHMISVDGLIIQENVKGKKILHAAPADAQLYLDGTMDLLASARPADLAAQLGWNSLMPFPFTIKWSEILGLLEISDRTRKAVIEEVLPSYDGLSRLPLWDRTLQNAKVQGSGSSYCIKNYDWGKAPMHTLAGFDIAQICYSYAAEHAAHISEDRPHAVAPLLARARDGVLSRYSESTSCFQAMGDTFDDHIAQAGLYFCARQYFRARTSYDRLERVALGCDAVSQQYLSTQLENTGRILKNYRALLMSNPVILQVPAAHSLADDLKASPLEDLAID